MKTLKSDIDVIEFLNTASDCRGDVWFYTAAGDEINLKSELSKYVFLTAAAQPGFLETSEVKVSMEADLERLGRFLAEDSR